MRRSRTALERFVDIGSGTMNERSFIVKSQIVPGAGEMPGLLAFSPLRSRRAGCSADSKWLSSQPRSSCGWHGRQFI